MNLFDFNVEEVSEEKVHEKFEELLDVHFKSGNPYYLNLNRVPSDLRPYIDYFEERQWLTTRRKDGFSIERSLLKYPTPADAIDEYQDKIEKALNSPDVCWYKTILPIRNFSSPYFRTDEEKKRYEEMKREVTEHAATTLGLEHFKNVPSSRGMKVNRFDSKFEKANTIPLIASFVIPITDIVEMRDFFNNHAFYSGRRDENWRSGSSITIAPYPEYKSFTPSEFDLACLCEAEDEKTIALILQYVGGSSSSTFSKYNKVLYPDGWNHTRYMNSLTDEDVISLMEDLARLKRLNNEIENKRAFI